MTSVTLNLDEAEARRLQGSLREALPMAPEPVPGAMMFGVQCKQCGHTVGYSKEEALELAQAIRNQFDVEPRKLCLNIAPSTFYHIQKFLREGKPVQAIKELRRNPGMKLDPKLCKWAVDEVRAGNWARVTHLDGSWYLVKVPIK